MIREAIKVIHSTEESRNTILAQMQDLCKTLPEYTVVRDMEGMRCAESILSDGDSVIISSVYDSGFKVCCFDNKISDEYKEGSCDIIKGEPQHGLGSYHSSIALDWQNTVGEALGGIVAEIKRQDNQYTMTYRYYLSDIYEWAYHYDSQPLNAILHSLHEKGHAQEYKMDGCIEGSFTWTLNQECFSTENKEEILANLVY